MQITTILIALSAYIVMLFVISWFSSRKASNSSFFSGDKKSPWFVVAYGMLGTSISVVTFVSVTGNVLHTNFYYMPLVFGFLAGYAVIATILLPLYYKMNLISIYGYLENRLGYKSYKTGAFFFLLSRILGASVRVFLAAFILRALIPSSMGIPFWLLAFVFMALLFLYTYKGGVKAIIWTDVLQTTVTLLAVVFTVWVIASKMNWSLADMVSAISNSEHSKMINTNWGESTHFLKQFLSGMFITIATVGLDQSMMQKNISVSTLGNAQKNMFTTSVILVIANFLFVVLGAVLVLYLKANNIQVVDSDDIFGTLSISYLGTGVAVFFVIGLISSSFPSAAGALTALTTSFCVDILHIDKKDNMSEAKKKKTRILVHLGYSLLFVALILFFFYSKNQAVIDLVYSMVAYTYGPLLGLFFFGILTKREVKDSAIPFVALSSPILCWLMEYYCKTSLDFSFGFTLLIFNGLFTFIGIYIFSYKKK